MYAARNLVQSVWQTGRISLRKCSLEPPAKVARKRSLLGTLGRGLGGLGVTVSSIGGIYYMAGDDLTKRQIRVTVQGINRFFR